MRGDNKVNLYDENQIKHKRIVDNTEKIIQMYKDGVKIKDIAKKIGVSYIVIYYLLRDNNTIIRKRKPRMYTGKKEKKAEKLKHFMERISKELKEQIKYNTNINDKSERFVLVKNGKGIMNNYNKCGYKNEE